MARRRVGVYIMLKTYETIGIDISKHKLDIYFNKKHTIISNDKKSINSWLNSLNKDNILRIACEASGGYEHTLSSLCFDKEFPLCIINARQVRDFAKGTGCLVKTDKVDANIIYKYAEILKPEPNLHLKNDKLRSLLKRRNQLVNFIKVEKQHTENMHDLEMLNDIEENIKLLNSRLELVETSIKNYIKSDSYNTQQLELLTSCKGVGWITAITFLAECPELGKISNAKLTSLIGLAPYNHESGLLKGRSHIQGGRQIVRNALYMATISAVRFNNDISKFYNHLKDKGKPTKVAIVACMRKLLIVLNSIIKRGTPWKEKIIQ